MKSKRKLKRYIRLVQCLKEAKRLAGEVKEELDGVEFPVFPTCMPSYSVDEMCKAIADRLNRGEPVTDRTDIGC